MPLRSSDDLWPPLGLLVVGMIAPGIVGATGGELLTLYVSAGQLIVAVAVAYGLLAWALIDRGAVDRTSFLLVSVIWPWILLVGTLLGLLLVNRNEPIPQGPAADVFRFLTTGWPGFFGYGAVFAVAGIAVVLVSRRYDRWAADDGRLPDPERLIAGTVGLVILVAVAVVGLNAASTGSAAVERVAPGTDYFQDPTLNVTVAGPAAELRVTAVAPDGTRVTKRLSRAAMRGGTETVAFPVEYDPDPSPGVLPVQDGRYRVRVVSLAGVPVDSATYRTGDAVDVSVGAVATTNETRPWSDSPPVVYERGSGNTTVGIAVTNQGAFHGAFSLTVGGGGDTLVVDRVFIEAGERVGVVLLLSADEVRSIRRSGDDMVAVTVYPMTAPEDPVASVRIRLPSR